MHLLVEEKKVGGEISRQRFGIFQPSSRALAKDRSGRLPVVMQDPTADKILARVRGEAKAPKKKKRTSTKGA
jgi:hypothetical protein